MVSYLAVFGLRLEPLTKSATNQLLAGKTISIKATMHMLSDRTPSIPSLYVRTLNSWSGPEFGIQLIFDKAREFAPCYLIFEDLDTIITEEVRSYFLNEVDGLKANDGIFIIASTNHLEKLDPGISVSLTKASLPLYLKS